MTPDTTPASAPTVETKDVKLDWSDIGSSGEIVEKVTAPPQPVTETPVATETAQPETKPRESEPVTPVQPVPVVQQTPVNTPVTADDPVTEFMHVKEKRPLRKSEAAKLLEDAVNVHDMRRSADEKFKAAADLNRATEAIHGRVADLTKQLAEANAKLASYEQQSEIAKLDPGEEPEEPEPADYAGGFSDPEYIADKAKYRVEHRAWEEKRLTAVIQKTAIQNRPAPVVESPLKFMTTDDYNRQLKALRASWDQKHADVSPELRETVAEAMAAEIGKNYDQGIPVPISVVEPMMNTLLRTIVAEQRANDIAQAKTVSDTAVARGEANQREANARGAESPMPLAGSSPLPLDLTPQTEVEWLKRIEADPNNEELANGYQKAYSEIMLGKNEEAKLRFMGRPV